MSASFQPGEYRRRASASKVYETIAAWTLAAGYVLLACGRITIGLLVICLGILLLTAAAAVLEPGAG